MTLPATPEPQNKLLSALPREEWLAIREHAEFVSFPAGQILFHTGDPITTAFFPDSGLAAAFAVLPTGEQVAAVAIGRDGLLGSPPLVGITTSTHEIRVKVGLTGYQLSGQTLRQAFERSGVVRQLLLNSVGRLYTQIARSAVCNRFHSQRERVARWLLVITEKTGQSSVAITHDALANMVGGPRHAVTEILHELRSLGLVQPVRGVIEVLDAAALAAIACDCYTIDLNIPAGTIGAHS